MTREERIAVFRENLELFAAGKFPYREETMYYDEDVQLEAEPPVKGGTRLEVVNRDCIEVTRELVEEGYRAAVLNMASRTNPGGGVENGAGAQEEQLCRRSNLLLSLYPFSRRAVTAYPELGLAPRKEQYPLHLRFGGIHSPDVTFFREGEDRGLRISAEPFKASVISVAGISHPRLDARGLMGRQDEELTRDKIRTILRIGMEHYHDALVLGALGCGAFANPPAQVARLFHDVFMEPEFKHQFRLVVFAILEDRNSLRNSKMGNFRPFRDEFCR